jgi:hypothetical protein
MEILARMRVCIVMTWMYCLQPVHRRGPRLASLCISRIPDFYSTDSTVDCRNEVLPQAPAFKMLAQDDCHILAGRTLGRATFNGKGDDVD